MVIYIDVLIILNIYITYFILRCCSRFFHEEYKLSRLILGSLFGGISSLSVLLGGNLFIVIAVRLLLVGVTVFIAFGFKNVISFIERAVFCFAVSMLICGGAEAIGESLDTGFISSVGGYPYMNISVIVLLISTIIIYCLICLLRRLIDKGNAEKSVCLIIENRGSSVKLNAFPDSGNNLVDFLTGMPVIICSSDKVKEILPDNIFLDTSLTGIRLIPWHSVSGGGIIRAFKPRRITAVYNREEKNLTALIGITEKESFKEETDAIINPKLLI